MPPPVALRVNVAAEVAAAFAAAVRVMVLLPTPGAEMLAGAKLAVTPFGKPLTANVTAALNPIPPVVETLT